MKKIVSIFAKIIAGIILLILVLLFTVPILFKEKIKTKVVEVINSSVNATVKFDDYKLGFFRNFPDLTFSMNGLSVVGINKFDKDTLAAFQSFNLVFNLSSLFGKSGYEVKSIIIDHAQLNVIYLKDGTANYDIMKPSANTSNPQPETAHSTMKIKLKKVVLLNSSIAYIDNQGSMSAYFNGVNFNMKGDMTLSETDLQMAMTSKEFTFIMDGVKYINKATVDSKIDMLANLDTWKFTFRENYFTLNDLKVNFSGTVTMPKADIATDIQFKTPQTSFKTLLSLVPAKYLKDFKDLKTSGEFSLSGSAKGIYSSVSNTMPDVTLDIAVNKGMVSYPSLPEQIKNINIKTNIFVDGKKLDNSIVKVDLFHMELAGSPFDMTFALKTPMSDPDFKGSMIGRIDLGALSKAIPMDSIKMSGLIDMSVQMEGRMSMIEKGQYESFKATGKMGIKNMNVDMIGYPAVKISDANVEFTPAYAAMTNTNLKIGGKSDFSLNGHIENYIPYVFSHKTIKGNLSLHSNFVDVSEIMSKMVSDTTAVKDTTSLTVMQVPKNIDFDLNAIMDQFSYTNIKAQNLKGHIIVRNGVLSIKDAGMNILNGTISMSADYDTRDSLKPVMKADIDMKNIEIKDAFSTFITIQKFAPAAKDIKGKISAKLVYSSLLGKNMMPVTNSINGEGKLQSDEITLLESKTFDQMKATLKLGDKYTNTFRNINISFKIASGRIFVSPFDVKTGNLKMNISGDQGIDQTINYLVKTEIPRADLGGTVNSFIDNLAAQASAFGISYKPSDVIKVNLKVTGTFNKPEVAPFFGNTSGDNTGGNKAAIKQTISDKAKEKGRSESEAQAAKLVKDAEEKGQAMRDEAAKTAAQMRNEANDQSQKLIDGAASKGTLAKMAAQKSAETIKKTADKKADQLVKEADIQANKLVEEAKAKSADLVKKI
jgi:hypothetical protein